MLYFEGLANFLVIQWGISIFFVFHGRAPRATRALQEPQESHMSNYRIVHEWASRGYDRKTCWVQARAGAVPAAVAGGHNPMVVMAMQKAVIRRL